MLRRILTRTVRVAMRGLHRGLPITSHLSLARRFPCGGVEGLAVRVARVHGRERDGVDDGAVERPGRERHGRAVNVGDRVAGHIVLHERVKREGRVARAYGGAPLAAHEAGVVVVRGAGDERGVEL